MGQRCNFGQPKILSDPTIDNPTDPSDVLACGQQLPRIKHSKSWTKHRFPDVPKLQRCPELSKTTLRKLFNLTENLPKTIARNIQTLYVMAASIKK